MPNQVDAYTAITGNWNDPIVWTDNGPPGSFTPIRDARIDGGTIAYTLSVTDAQNAGSVTLNDTFATLDVASGGSLLLGGGVDPTAAATLDLADGTFSLEGIVGSSVTAPLVIQEGSATTTYSGGTLNNVAIQGTLDLSGIGAALTSTGGLLVVNPTAGSRGIINITGDQAVFTVASSETLSDVALALGGTPLAAPTTPEIVVGSGATLTINSASTVSLPGNATISGPGSLVLSAGLSVASVSNGSTLGFQTAATENDTTLDAGSGTINVTGALTGSGTITAGAPGGIIDLASTAAASQTIALTAGDTLILEGSSPANPNAVAALITGLAANTIDLTNVGFSANLVGSVASGGVLTITDSGTTEAVFNTDIADGTSVTFSADAASTGTDVNVACFCPGTAIRTPGGEVAVERLAISDMVVTASGMTERVRWIGRRSYAGRFARGNKAVLPIRISAGALADGVPCRDLWLSPKHALLLDGVLIPAEVLVNGRSIVQAGEVDSVEYFHVELDRHDALLAEGAAAESFVDDNSRGMFHNAHEHAALYPDARPAPALYCAPRLVDGEQVEAVRRRLTRRADPAALSGYEGLGTLRGQLDMIVDGRLYGWAQHAACPEAPVCLELLLDDRVVTQVLANRYRSDLWHAGLGSGCHAFELTVPDSLSARTRSFGLQSVRLRRAADGAELPNPFGVVPGSAAQRAPERDCAA